MALPIPHDTDANLAKANSKFIEIAKRYNLNPVLLKDIMVLRNKGYNNLQIAEQTGINKNTVNKYVNALGDMDSNDLVELLITIGIIVGGAYVIYKLLDALYDGS